MASPFAINLGEELERDLSHYGDGSPDLRTLSVTALSEYIYLRFSFWSLTADLNASGPQPYSPLAFPLHNWNHPWVNQVLSTLSE